MTVLLATYDGARWIDEQVASVEAQTHRPALVIVRDDGSSDDTVALVKSWSQRSAVPVRVIEGEQRLGACRSFLELLTMVETPLFAFCDQDDRWHPDRLARGCAALADRLDTVAATCTDAALVDADGIPTGSTALRHRYGPGPVDTSFGSLLLLNAAIGTTMTGTAPLAAAAVEVAGHGAPFMHDWLCALLATDGDGLLLDRKPSIDYRRHEGTVTGTPAPWWRRLPRELGRSVAGAQNRRSELLARAAANAAPLAEAGVLGSDNQRLAELMVEMGSADSPGRRELLRLRRAGVRPRPLGRELAWYR